ncbi:MerR family DNA-binding transcriptional regulator [Stutzerimonas balearica]|nr:MerR family DNA-binding transcriptional regulator [Stutzerimonas balearica]
MSEAEPRLSIGQFAARTGLSADTLRYYEKIGLLRHTVRDASGHRVYGARDVE